MPAPPIEIRTLPGTTTNFLVRGQGYFPAIAALCGNEVLVALRGGADHLGLAGHLASGRLITVYYSTGTRATPHDFHAPINAYCQAICYSENVLLEAGAD